MQREQRFRIYQYEENCSYPGVVALDTRFSDKKPNGDMISLSSRAITEKGHIRMAREIRRNYYKMIDANIPTTTYQDFQNRCAFCLLNYLGVS